VTPTGEEGLEAFVRSVVRRASIPRKVADDVAEEMRGHLVERSEALIAGGATEDDAVERAIADFGPASDVGDELGRTYHSRLWLSTVGVLLAAGDPTASPPGAIRALRLLLALNATLVAAVGVVVILAETPVLALLTAMASAVFVTAVSLAYRGLGIGRGWALTFAVGVAFVLIGSGFLQIGNAPEGTTTIPVEAIVAGAILLWVYLSWDRVRAFIQHGRPIGPRLGSAMAGALLGPTLVFVTLPHLADPTQASASDVDMRLAMACGRRDLQIPDGSLVRDRQYADLTVDLFWRRSDVMPHGVGSLFGSSAGGDTAGFRILEPAPIAIEGGGAIPVWTLDIPAQPTPSVTVVETGEVAGSFGATGISEALIPRTMGSFTVFVDEAPIQSGRTIRITWSIRPDQDGAQPWPRIEVAYAHLDRFLLLGQVACGEHTTGSADATPAPEQDPFLP
jgi:hypothetical protein